MLVLAGCGDTSADPDAGLGTDSGPVTIDAGPDGGAEDAGPDGVDAGGCGPATSAGTSSSCSVSVTCNGTTYMLACDTAAGTCTCSVNGDPGPAITETECSTAALEECGVPL